MQKIAGLLLFIAGALILLGIVTAEIFYPSPYSISQNMISNLGATPPPDSIIRQPSAAIFDTAMLFAGLCIAFAALILTKKHVYFFASLLLMGCGTLGVGLFPAYHVVDHPVAALLAFASGGVAAVFSFSVIRGPFRYIAIGIGCVSLGFLLLGLLAPQSIVPFIGKGGTERWVAYPLILWLVGFGGYLLNKYT